MKMVEIAHNQSRVAGQREKAIVREAGVICKSYEDYIERRRIEGYMNLYKAIMKVKPSVK